MYTGFENLRDIPLSRVMVTDLICVDVGTTPSTVDRLMSAHGIHHLPVVRDRQLVGLVSQRDLLRNGLSAYYLENEAEQHSFLDNFTVLAQIMTPDPVTLGPERPVSEALGLMLEFGIGCVPVVDAHNTLLGIVTREDLLRLLQRLLNGQPPVKVAPAAASGAHPH